MIAVLGEALVDLLPAGRPGLYRARPGGSPANVALGLGRLGIPTSFFGGISRDAWGDWIRARLREAGVEAAGPFTELPTPLARVEPGGAEAAYAFYLCGTAFEAGDWPDPRREVRAVHTGSLATALEPAAGEVLAWLERRPQAFLSFDPNVRPGITPPSFRNRFWELLGRVNLLKLSAADLDWLVPDTPRAKALNRLRERVGWLVLTLGAAGAVGFSGENEVHLPPPQTRVLDTVGAGDAFTAGLLAWAWRHGRLSGAQIDREALEQALGCASLVAGMTLERAGADPPGRAEVAARGGNVCEA